LITPNKVLSLKESVLGRICVLLKAGPMKTDLVSLYHDVASDFESVDEFILAVDTLFILGHLDIDFGTRIVSYAD
jgi:hypothetical protein